MIAKRFSLRQLDHVQLAMPVGQEAEARAFYSQLLGLREVQKPEPLRSRGGCWFEGGDVRLHLGVEADFRPARKAHPALTVDALDVLATALEKAAYKPVYDTALPGVKRFYVYDPFGNRLEFIQEHDRYTRGNSLE